MDASCKNIDLFKGKPFSIFFYRYRYQLLTLKKKFTALIWGGFAFGLSSLEELLDTQMHYVVSSFQKGGKEVSMYGIGPVCPWLSSQDTVGLQILALNHIWCKIYSSLKLHTYLVLTVMVSFQVHIPGDNNQCHTQKSSTLCTALAYQEQIFIARPFT